MNELSRPTILVVDDTESNVDILVENLSEEYEVSVAMDGADALTLAEEIRPDLILLDIMMPELTINYRQIKFNEFSSYLLCRLY